MDYIIIALIVIFFLMLEAKLDKVEGFLIVQLDTITRRVEKMATKSEVLAAIAEEKTEVLASIQALKDQVTNGSPVTAADLDEIRDAVKGIHGPDS